MPPREPDVILELRLDAPITIRLEAAPSVAELARLAAKRYGLKLVPAPRQNDDVAAPAPSDPPDEAPAPQAPDSTPAPSSPPTVAIPSGSTRGRAVDVFACHPGVWLSVGDVYQRIGGAQSYGALRQAIRALLADGWLEHNGKATTARRYRLAGTANVRDSLTALHRPDDVAPLDPPAPPPTERAPYDPPDVSELPRRAPISEAPAPGTPPADVRQHPASRHRLSRRVEKLLSHDANAGAARRRTDEERLHGTLEGRILTRLQTGRRTAHELAAALSEPITRVRAALLDLEDDDEIVRHASGGQQRYGLVP